MVKVTIIIPTYGNPVYLRKGIDSIFNQTINNWELIVVDDNDPGTEAREKTEVLLNEYLAKDNRVIYIKHDRNRNGAVARNTGFAVAKGEYISLLDSDDEYMPDRLQKCCDILDKAPLNVAGVYTGCEFRRKGKVFNKVANVQSGNFLVETLACRFQFSTGSNVFVRKSVIDELNGFDPSFLRHQDYEFLVRLFVKYKLIGLPEILVIKNNENWNVPDIGKLIAIKDQYLNKYQSIISHLDKEKQNYIYYWKNITLAESAMRQGRYSLANKFYNEASQYGTPSLKIWFRRIVYPLYNLIKR